jgi:release factor glutamine methyltransferase
MPEVREHEPVTALDGGADGLDFYREIVQKSRKFLVGGGMLFFEIGYDQGADVKELLERNGFADVRIVKDYAGLDRVVYGTFIE